MSCGFFNGLVFRYSPVIICNGGGLRLQARSQNSVALLSPVDTILIGDCPGNSKTKTSITPVLAYPLARFNCSDGLPGAQPHATHRFYLLHSAACRGIT